MLSCGTEEVKAKNADEAIRLAAGKSFTLKAENFVIEGKREPDKEELKHVVSA